MKLRWRLEQKLSNPTCIYHALNIINNSTSLALALTGLVRLGQARLKLTPRWHFELPSRMLDAAPSAPTRQRLKKPSPTIGNRAAVTTNAKNPKNPDPNRLQSSNLPASTPSTSNHHTSTHNSNIQIQHLRYTNVHQRTPTSCTGIPEYALSGDPDVRLPFGTLCYRAGLCSFEL